MSELIDKLHTQATEVTGTGICTAGGFNHEKFAELILLHVLKRIEDEIGTAYDLGDVNTAATLEGLALTILDDFDMELLEEE